MLDTEAAATQADITSFIPTYSRLGDLAKAEMTDIDPQLIDAVMTEEYSEVYEGLMKIAKLEQLNLTKADDLELLAVVSGLTPDETASLQIRHEINTKYGANEQFLGNGLTRDINSTEGMGTVETYSLDKNPVSLGELEKQGILRRIQLTSH